MTDMTTTTTTNRRTFLATLLAGAAATALMGRAALAADKEPKKEGEWEKLGEKTAGRQEARHAIDVGPGTRYTAISFRVAQGDVEVEDVKVTFDDDKTFEPTTRLTFREGERSGKIDLPGNSRGIKRVRFLCRSTGRGDAVIVVYGKVGEPAKG